MAKFYVSMFKYICNKLFSTVSTHLGVPGKDFCLFNILDNVAK